MLPWKQGKPKRVKRVPWVGPPNIAQAKTDRVVGEETKRVAVGDGADVKLSAKQAHGQGWEQKAMLWLMDRGLTPVACNVRFRIGEIDLIMRDSTTAIIVEVRRRENARHGLAIDSIDSRKRCKITRTAQLWWETNGRHRFEHLRFDVVTFEQNNVPHWVSHAWTLDGWL